MNHPLQKCGKAQILPSFLCMCKQPVNSLIVIYRNELLFAKIVNTGISCILHAKAMNVIFPNELSFTKMAQATNYIVVMQGRKIILSMLQEDTLVSFLEILSIKSLYLSYCRSNDFYSYYLFTFHP